MISGIHHLGLTVRDVEASATWYERVLGFQRVDRHDSPDGARRKVFLRHDGVSVRLGLTQHRDGKFEDFDETRVGLDHLAFAVNDRDDLHSWAARLADAAVEFSPIVPANSIQGAFVLVLRDPDNIQLELFADRSDTARWTTPTGLVRDLAGLRTSNGNHLRDTSTPPSRSESAVPAACRKPIPLWGHLQAAGRRGRSPRCPSARWWARCPPRRTMPSVAEHPKWSCVRHLGAVRTWLPVVAVMLAGGCGDEARRVIEIQSVSPDGRTLVVTFESCNGHPELSASETEERVVLSASGGDTPDDCADGARVVLDQPLGDREVLDKVTGESVPILG